MQNKTLRTNNMSKTNTKPTSSQQTTTIDAPSGQLFAIVHTPVAKDVKKCIIMLNSGMVNRCGPQRIYRALANQACVSNIAVIRVDLAGVGDSIADIYETHFDNHRKEDVKAVIDYARQQWPDAKIILQGICAGARVAFKAAATNQDVAGILSWSNEIFTASQNMPQSPTEPEDRMSEYVVSDTFSRTLRFFFTFTFLKPSWWREQFPGGKGFVEEFNYTILCLVKKILPKKKHAMGEFLQSADLYIKDKRKVYFAFGEHDNLAHGEFRTRFPKIPEGTELAQTYSIIETGTHTFSTVLSQQLVIKNSLEWVEKHIK